MHTVRAVLVPANIWRVGVTLAALVALLLLARFVLADGGSVIFTLVMAWFLSLAMEPAVAKLSTRMRRSVATGLVMAATGVFAVGFLVAFGSLFVDQAVQLLQILPAVIEALFDWVNRTSGLTTGPATSSPRSSSRRMTRRATRRTSSVGSWVLRARSRGRSSTSSPSSC